MTFFKTSDGVNLYYEVKGEGNPIFLIHGWSQDHTGFAPQLEALSKKYKVVALDLRGHGKSDRPEHGLTLKRFATDVEELMENLQLENVTLVGHSMGASTTFEYIKDFGVSRLKSVSIFDMTPKLVNDSEWNLGLYHGKYFIQDALNDLTQINDNLIDFARPFFKITAPYLSDELIEEQLEFFKSNTPHVLSAMWHAMAVNDYRNMLEKITVPTQIVYGEKSTLYSKETAEYLQSKIPNAKVVPFENCTHLLVAENPDKTTEVIDQIASI